MSEKSEHIAREMSEKSIKINEQSDHIEVKKETLWKIATFVFAGLFVVSLFWNSGSIPSLPTGKATGNPGPNIGDIPTQPSNVKASVDDDAVLGDENAPVTIIEFSDYQCPFCRKFFVDTLPQIKSQYIDQGKVKLVFRDFPLDSIHPGAIPAAIAAECAGEQGNDAYFKMHDKIFGEQSKQGVGTVQFDSSDLKQWAKDLGYNIDNCLDSQKHLKEVQKDSSDAQASGGQGTPYFVIVGSDGNGIPLSGAQPFNAFDAALKAAGA